MQICDCSQLPLRAHPGCEIAQGKTRGTLEDYLREHSSEAAKEYMRQYEEAHARLQPGEHV